MRKNLLQTVGEKCLLYKLLAHSPCPFALVKVHREHDIESAIAESARRHVPAESLRIIRPHELLARAGDHTHLSCFHYNRHGCDAIAEAIAAEMRDALAEMALGRRD